MVHVIVEITKYSLMRISIDNLWEIQIFYHNLEFPEVIISHFLSNDIWYALWHYINIGYHNFHNIQWALVDLFNPILVMGHYQHVTFQTVTPILAPQKNNDLSTC